MNMHSVIFEANTKKLLDHPFRISFCFVHVLKKKPLFRILIQFQKSRKMEKQLENKCFNEILDAWEEFSPNMLPFQHMFVEIQVDLSSEMYYLLKDRMWNDFGILMLFPALEEQASLLNHENKIYLCHRELTDAECKQILPGEWQDLQALTETCSQENFSKLGCILMQLQNKANANRFRKLLRCVQESHKKSLCLMKGGVLYFQEEEEKEKEK